MRQGNTLLKTILVVEDEAATGTFGAHAVRRLGYGVVTASTCHQAVEAAVAGTSIRLMLINTSIAPGIDIREAITEIRKINPIPILFLTSHSGVDTTALIAWDSEIGVLDAHPSDTVLRSSIETAFRLGDAVEQARRCQEHFTSLFNNVNDAIVFHEAGLQGMPGKIVDVNSVACTRYGFTRDEFLQMTLADIESAESKGKNSGTLQPLYKQGTVVSKSVHVSKDGMSIPVEISSTLVDYRGAQVILASIRDITDRKRLEQQLLQSHKLEGVGTLVGGIANDFNNLLAMVLGSAELLRAHVAGQEECEKYVNRIIEASERGASISRQLLIFSRPDFAELKPISLSHTISEMEEMLKHFLRKTIVIKTTIALENGIIMGDGKQIQQALLNLALNADDAMGGTGTLTIKAATIAPEYFKKRFMFESPVPFVAVSISDTGIGMEEPMIAQIFDPYFTTKDRGKGTGLGLAIVHGIVKNHNGFIDVESTPGIGSTFTLYFPTVARVDDATQAPEPQQAQINTESILVVDDEILLRDTLREYLGQAGYRVSTATNGIEALEYFKVHYNTIDLVITDLGMPEMGGEELYRVLHKIDPTLKVIITSGFLDGSTRSQLFEMGVKDVLTKPYRMREIKRVVRTILNGD